MHRWRTRPAFSSLGSLISVGSLGSLMSLMSLSAPRMRTTTGASRRRAARFLAPAASLLLLLLLLGVLGAPAASHAAAAVELPLGKANYAIAVGGLNATSRTNWVRLGQYTFATDGTVSEQHWHWTQRTRVQRADTGFQAQNCVARNCSVLTAGGWQSTAASQTMSGTYTVTGSRLRIVWSNGLWEEWTLGPLASGALSNVELAGNDFGATYGFGNGSNAAWNARISAATIAAIDQNTLVHRYHLWKTNQTSSGFEGYIDSGDGSRFWVPAWSRCDGGQCLGAVTTSNGGAASTQYYISPARTPTGHRRDTLWHWRTSLADARNEHCYTGNSHVKPMYQIVDDNGRFHGWVGVEASLNQTTQYGADDDDIGVFRILG